MVIFDYLDVYYASFILAEMYRSFVMTSLKRWSDVEIPAVVPQ